MCMTLIGAGDSFSLDFVVCGHLRVSSTAACVLVGAGSQGYLPANHAGTGASSVIIRSDIE